MNPIASKPGVKPFLICAQNPIFWFFIRSQAVGMIKLQSLIAFVPYKQNVVKKMEAAPFKYFQIMD